MAKPIIIDWPAQDNDGICLLQTLGAAGSLTINGVLATTLNSNSPYVKFSGFNRTVTITSPSNNSTVTFTINGTYRGALQTENILGPNAGTVETTDTFDTITSITTNAATVGSGVSVGTGTAGATSWILYNYNATVSALSVTVDVTGTITYSFRGTLDDVQTNPTPRFFSGLAVPDTTGPNAFRLAMSAASLDDMAFANYPFSYYQIAVTSGSGSLRAAFVQQGLT